ncbi:hypothetical protein HY990_03135 [Candidatus Micrarchaeota archaeon]|nr:hypothetical protein [Candidatus Micrarchaeota archaeon]
MKAMKHKLSLASGNKHSGQSSFKGKSVLLDSKKKAVVKSLLISPAKKKPQKKSSRLSTITSAVAPVHSVKKNHLPEQLQQTLADKLYEAYRSDVSAKNNTAYSMWGVGFMLPAAFEVAGVATGISIPDVKTFLLANLAFAGVFRFTLGNEALKGHNGKSSEKQRRAVDLIKSGKMTSHKAQHTLSKMVPSSHASEVLSNQHLTDESAQLEILTSHAKSIDDKGLAALEGNSHLGKKAKEKIKSILQWRKGRIDIFGKPLKK